MIPGPDDLSGPTRPPRGPPVAFGLDGTQDLLPDEPMATEPTLGDEVDLPRSSMAKEKTLRPLGAGPVSGGPDIQELWYRLLTRPWFALVVVSPDETPSTLRVARGLAEFGAQHQRRPIDLIDGLQLDLDRASAIAHRIAPEEGPPRPAEPRFIVALESPTANPIAIEVLLAADAILLLVRKGVTRIPQARKIIEIAGRERIIGAVLDVE